MRFTALFGVIVGTTRAASMVGLGITSTGLINRNLLSAFPKS